METCIRRLFITLAAVLVLWPVLQRPVPAQASQLAYNKIEGESYDVNDSRGVSASWENGGEIESLGWIDNGDYACYKKVSFSRGVSKIYVRFSKKCHPSVSVKLILDNPNSGTTIANISMSSATGTKWTDFVTYEYTINQKVSGTHDLYLKFSSLETREQLLHIDWIQFSPSADSSSVVPPGYILTDSNGIQYKVLKGSQSVALISIPKTMEILYMENLLKLKDGTILYITNIGANACKGCKKLKAVYIGKNVKTISKNAFRNCSHLSTVIFMGTGAKKKVSVSAFYGIKSKAKFYIPKKNLSYFKKLFKKYKKTSHFKLYRYKGAVG